MFDPIAFSVARPNLKQFAWGCQNAELIVCQTKLLRGSRGVQYGWLRVG